MKKMMMKEEKYMRMIINFLPLKGLFPDLKIFNDIKEDQNSILLLKELWANEN